MRVCTYAGRRAEGDEDAPVKDVEAIDRHPGLVSTIECHRTGYRVTVRIEPSRENQEKLKRSSREPRKELRLDLKNNFVLLFLRSMAHVALRSNTLNEKTTLDIQ